MAWSVFATKQQQQEQPQQQFACTNSSENMQTVCALSRSILTFSTFKLGCRAYCLFHVTFDGILFHSISVPLSSNTYKRKIIEKPTNITLQYENLTTTALTVRKFAVQVEHLIRFANTAGFDWMRCWLRCCCCFFLSFTQISFVCAEFENFVAL